jgi:hypothetical protein
LRNERKESSAMNVFTSFLRAWFGEEEYQKAWHTRSRTWSFLLRFWGRLALASAGLCFFLWQQRVEPSRWWGSDGFGMVVLALTASQAAGPGFYLLFHVTRRVFLTEHYLETLQEGRFYVTMKSALCLVLMTILSILAVSGVLGSRWYIKPLVFLLTVPVACFWVFFPALNRAAGRVRGLPKERHTEAGSL